MQSRHHNCGKLQSGVGPLVLDWSSLGPVRFLVESLAPSAAITLKIYTHIFTNADARAGEIMEARFAKVRV
jgi:hypothetical protein